jgi:hypothetical protein
LSPQGLPFLALFDREGKTKVSANVYDNGCPGIALDSADGKSQILLTISNEGSPRIWLSQGDAEDARVGLLVDRDGTAALHLWDRTKPEGEGSISLFAHADGELSLAFWHDDEATPRIAFYVTAAGDISTVGVNLQPGTDGGT